MEAHETADVRVVIPKMTLSAIVDPTPTPTRFFRLGEDTSGPYLQKKSRNPFEESFRRASLQMNHLPRVPSPSKDEPLETPVAPKVHHWPKVSPTSKRLSEKRKLMRLNVSPALGNSTLNTSTCASSATAFAPSQSETQGWTLESGVPAESRPSFVRREIPVLEENAMDMVSTDAFLVATKEISTSVKNVRALRLPNGKTVPVVPDQSVMFLSASGADQSPKKVRKLSGASQTSSDSESVVTKRERNRVAATRSRQKRKKMMSAMQERHEKLLEENAALRRENEELKQKLVALTTCLLGVGTGGQPVTLIVPPGIHPVPQPPQALVSNDSDRVLSSSRRTSSNVPILPKP